MQSAPGYGGRAGRAGLLVVELVFSYTTEEGLCGAGIFVNLLKRDFVLQTRFLLEAAIVPEKVLRPKYP